MGLPLYLAMTAAELQHCPSLPSRPAWMACHFSSYSTGITNIPAQLPDNTLLILNDRTPVHGHDPHLVARQLSQAVEDTGAEAVLLDLQRECSAETAAIVAQILSVLSCPVAVTPDYAKTLSCPVFLPPPPLLKTLQQYLAAWQDREIWLEAERSCRCFTVTESGCVSCDGFIPSEPVHCHTDNTLRCRYTIEVAQKQAQFTLWRDDACLAALWEEAAGLGVTRCVGLYQEGWPLAADSGRPQ